MRVILIVAREEYESMKLAYFVDFDRSNLNCEVRELGMA